MRPHSQCKLHLDSRLEQYLKTSTSSLTIINAQMSFGSRISLLTVDCCYSISLQTKAVCVCNVGYDSPMCATWTGVWSAWTPWSHCLPACGVERWAIRTRRCLVAERFGSNPEHIDCRGPSVEFTLCDPHSCARKSFSIERLVLAKMLQWYTIPALSSTK